MISTARASPSPSARSNVAIAKIRREGKATPVLFGHQIGDALSVLGLVPPSGWRITPEGLTASGWIDVSDVLGQRIHRMLGAGALQWSIGFRMPKKRPGPDGTSIIESIGELNEISVTALPANERTRTTSAKSLRPVPSLADLRAREQCLLGDTDGHYKTLLYDTTLRLLCPDQTKITSRTVSHKTAPRPDSPTTPRPTAPRARPTGPVHVARYDA